MIRLEQVGLRLPSAAGDVNVLQDLSLCVAAGERLAVTGPSGSGKSTLMMVMAGLEGVSAGRVTVLGRDLSACDEEALAALRRDHLGIVFQAFHLVPTMSALDNVMIPLELRGQRDAEACAREALAQVGLTGRAQHLPGQLSGGEQQRVALARAFAARPALLLADEPTGNLDTVNGRRVADLMFDYCAARRATLVLITHEAELAARCDRILRLEDGRVVAESRPETAGTPAP